MVETTNQLLNFGNPCEPRSMSWTGGLEPCSKRRNLWMCQSRGRFTPPSEAPNLMMRARLDGFVQTWYYVDIPILGPADVSKDCKLLGEIMGFFTGQSTSNHHGAVVCPVLQLSWDIPFGTIFGPRAVLNEDITFTGVSWLFTILSWHPLYPSLANNKQGRPVYSPLKVKMENLGFPTSELNTYLDSNEAGRGLGFFEK